MRRLAVELTLTIPDNEALTALATLQRLGVHVGTMVRADIWLFDVHDSEANALLDAVQQTETIYNPNKHRLSVRDKPEALSGEVWVGEPDSPAAHAGPPYRFASRDLPGVTALDRFVAWRLFDHDGNPAPEATVQRAVETLLCNPAFQRAIR
jgi:phosphoribosylformylglycinamidine (FGAM) synthase PurS component